MIFKKCNTSQIKQLIEKFCLATSSITNSNGYQVKARMLSVILCCKLKVGKFLQQKVCSVYLPTLSINILGSI